MAVSVVAACAICAFAVANASAALPEWGKCVKVPVTIKEKVKTKGAYADANCTEKTGGEYEFLKGSSAVSNTEFTNTMTTPEAVLELSVGLQVKCTGETATGHLSGAKEVSGVTVTFTGCYSAQLRSEVNEWDCDNQFQRNEEQKRAEYIAGEIVTNTLKGKLGYISGKGTATPVVGLELEPQEKHGLFAFFGCNPSANSVATLYSNVGEKPRGKGGGDAIISPISPVNKMGTETTQVYARKQVENPETHELEAEKGIQEPTALENGKPAFLESQLFGSTGSGTEWFPASQEETAVTKLVSGEELEIKA
jgi:hypothetical protein